MKPTELLMEEHRVIEQVLGCLQKMSAIAEATGKLNCEHAHQALEFIRHFADHCHHQKEEDQLFALMEHRGFAQNEGPIAVMLDEHQTGRFHVGGMADALAAYEQGDKCAAQTFVNHARAYCELLKDHIVKEDFILYPLADEAFSAEDQEVLGRAFDEVEAGHANHHALFLAVAEQLGEYYQVPRPTEPNREALSGICPAHSTLPCCD